jgi:hypothetical protein
VPCQAGDCLVDDDDAQDLSHLPQDQTIEYIRAALPALNEMRRRTGLPHRVRPKIVAAIRGRYDLTELPDDDRPAAVVTFPDGARRSKVA